MKFTLFSLVFAIVALPVVEVPLLGENSDTLKLQFRTRAKSPDGRASENQEINAANWAPEKTAMIICDMWDDHTCKGAAARVAEMAPSINHFAKTARDRGVFVVHAPSGRMDYYQDTPQRQRAVNAPEMKASVPIQWNKWDPDREGPPMEEIFEGGCACAEPCYNFEVDESGFRHWKRGPELPWTRQIDTIEIHPEDAISDKGEEIYNLLQQRGIDNVILLGVHTNICVSGRPFGLRQMTYHGKNVVLVRDLTDGLFQPVDSDLDHIAGNELIVKHIEASVAPTMLSSDITNTPPFKFQQN